MKLDSLSVLILSEKDTLRKYFIQQCFKYFFKVDIVEDTKNLINAYREHRYSIVILNNKENNINFLVENIRKIKKKQLIIISCSEDNKSFLNENKIFYFSDTYIDLNETLLKLKETILDRNNIRNEMLSNRLKLILENKENNYTPIYDLNSKHIKSKDLTPWFNICENCLNTNEKFKSLIYEINNDTFSNIYLKKLAQVLNNYYQIFALISQTEDLSLSLINYSCKFYSYRLNENSKSSFIKLINYLYIELLYFQYILFYRNEIKNINYFKRCTLNTLNLLNDLD